MLFGESAVSSEFKAQSSAYGQSQRERGLAKLEAAFLGVQYDGRKWLWDGRENRGTMVEDTVVRYSLDLPGRHERVPCVQTKLAGTVVRRFTEMLFGVKRRPVVESVGDKAGSAWLRRAFAVSHAWEELTKARDNGGAMGTAVVLVRLKDGQLRLDALNPRNCRPKWKDRKVLELESVEEVYPFFEEEEKLDGGREQVEYLYRRVVDGEKDRIWRAVKKPKGAAGMTGAIKWGKPDEEYEHRLGECPVVWCQNEDVDEEIDGRSDFDGQVENIEQIDILESEATASIVHNLDATLVLTRTSARDAGVVRTGHFNSLCLPQEGSSASFLEVSGGSIKAGDDRAQKLRSMVLEACQCVLVDPKDLPGMGQGQDALEALFRPMLSRCDRMREQYGKLVERVARLMVRLVQQASDVGEEVEVLVESQRKGESQEQELVPLSPPGKKWICKLSWPRYFEPTADDRQKETMSAGAAVRDKVVSKRTAVTAIASLWNVDDVDGELEEIKKDAEEEQALLSGGGGEMFGAEEGAEGEEPLPGEEEELPPEGEEVEELTPEEEAEAQALALGEEE